jgi:riboflavin biosynthesis pyrimidine reductase
MLWPTPRRGGAERSRNPADVDPAVVYGADSRKPVGDRPWVLANMIASIDGAATDPTGRSAGLGGPADLRVFSAIRAVADVVLAGAGTVRTERYGPLHSRRSGVAAASHPNPASQSSPARWPSTSISRCSAMRATSTGPS